jgi:hypothetical protein
MKVLTSMEKDEINEVKDNLYGNILKNEEDDKKNDNIVNIKKEKENEFNFVNSKEEKGINMETEKSKGNRRIIKKLKINKFCTYLCFFCA